MAKHIQYEIDEFRNSFQDLPGLRGNSRQWNRALESMLLHFRVLRAFFFDEGTHPKSDVHASDFVSSWQPARDLVFDSTKDAVDKTVAHLTLERLTHPTMLNWTQLDDMKKAMENLIKQFSQFLSPQQASWFPRLSASQFRETLLGAADNRTDSGPR